VGEHFPLTTGRRAAIPRDPHPQPQRMPDHRHIGHLAHDGVAVDTLTTAAWTVAAAVVEQVAEHHRDIAVDSGVSDRHTEFNSAHDRVGNNSSGQGRRLGHRAPRQVGDTA
jgi:hypothetical protein